jgi:hypothetical protein
MTRSSAPIYLVTLVVGSVLAATYAIVARSYGIQPSHAIAYGWPVAFLILLVLWLVEDSRSYPTIYKPFEYGFLVYILAPVYLPYYCWRTRRFSGLLLLTGLIALYILGSLGQVLPQLAS